VVAIVLRRRGGAGRGSDRWVDLRLKKDEKPDDFFVLALVFDRFNGVGLGVSSAASTVTTPSCRWYCCLILALAWVFL
jgi:hypothetical protein